MKNAIKWISSIITLCAASFAFSSSIPPAHIMNVDFTANSLVSPLPNGTTSQRISVAHPWEMRIPPSFAISATPRSDQIFVSPNDTMVTLEMVQGSLIWFYYCSHLHLNYTAKNKNVAAITFTGHVDTNKPGGLVQCKCTGPICSTQKPVLAQLAIRRA